METMFPVKNKLWSLNNIRIGPPSAPRLWVPHLELPSGLTAITGSSGAGKSTLLHVLTGFIEPDQGTCVLHSSGETDRLPLYWAPQHDGLWEWMTATQHLEAVSPTADAAPEIWLDLLDMESRQAQRPSEMSRGERNRLALARALASQAAVLVFDEPLAHVSQKDGIRIWGRVIEALRVKQQSLVFATHTPWIAEVADQQWEMVEGNIS